ncbi:MAG: class I SAM-dependent methyltransferase [Bacteroidetes bacterium]|nr:class I SAM-dependent methyltransferase [Bacteroidota bacterium]
MDNYQITIDTFNTLAQRYQERYMDVKAYHDGFALFCNHIPQQGASILEIGCGPGNVARYLLELRPDLQLHGIDLAPNMVDLARQNNPGATFEVMDARHIHELTSHYDAVMCAFCLPYLSKEDVQKLFKDCFRLLKPGGMLYLSTMEDDYSKSGFESSSDRKHKAYLYYHHETHLRPMLEENGFEIIHLSRQPYQKSDTETMTDLIILAGKK